MPQGTPTVDLIAHPTGAVLTGPSSNRALDLADSLKGVNENLGPAIQGFAATRQAKLAAQAEADAMANSGQAFGDAVRSGKIQPTQNPWYIQAYEKNAATVRGQQEVSDLVQQSGTWASRNDAPSFQKEFTEKLGEIQKKYTGPDQAAGFQAAANPLMQQTIQQNVQYNVSRIKEQRVQDISTLATTNILTAKTAAGGHPTPAQVFASMEPQHKDWISTGGTEADWNQLVINSVIAAGYNSADSTILSVLDDPRDGKGALSNIAGPDGKPVAETLSTARHYIDQIAEDKGMSEIKAKQNAIKAEGGKASQMVWDQYGYAFLKGTVPASDVIDFLQSKGVSPQAAAYAVGDLGKSAGDKQSLSRALMGSDPEILSLYAEANQGGLTASLQARIAEKVRTGGMDVNEGEQILGTAQSRSNHFDSENRADIRQVKSDSREDARAKRELTTQTAADLKTYRTRLTGDVALRLEQAGVKALRDPKTRTQFEQGLEDAEGRSLRNNPGDPIKAQEVVDTYAAAYIKTYTTRKKRAPTTGASSTPGGNPRS